MTIDKSDERATAIDCNGVSHEMYLDFPSGSASKAQRDLVRSFSSYLFLCRSFKLWCESTPAQRLSRSLANKRKNLIMSNEIRNNMRQATINEGRPAIDAQNDAARARWDPKTRGIDEVKRIKEFLGIEIGGSRSLQINS